MKRILVWALEPSLALGNYFIKIKIFASLTGIDTLNLDNKNLFKWSKNLIDIDDCRQN